MDDRVESVSTTPVVCVANYDRKQTKNQRNFFFTSDVWLLISLKDSNIQEAVAMKNILPI